MIKNFRNLCTVYKSSYYYYLYIYIHVYKKARIVSNKQTMLYRRITNISDWLTLDDDSKTAEEETTARKNPSSHHPFLRHDLAGVLDTRILGDDLENIPFSVSMPLSVFQADKCTRWSEV